MLAQQRIQTIDVLRGLTIAFMIIVNNPGTWEFVYAPLKHASWNGCTPTDLVFPFFLFVVGLSMAHSFIKMENWSWKEKFTKITKRTIIIFGIGLLLNWFPFYDTSIYDLRVFGVLQRIALAFFFAGIIIISIRSSWHFVFTIIVLLLYYVILILGVDGDALSLEHNLVRKIDLALLGPSHVYHGYGLPFDPEGFLSTMGSIGNVMFGYILAKKQMAQKEMISSIKMAFGFGLLLIATGFVWNFTGFPINKPIWSSSYAFFSSGLCAILYGLMMYVIDLKEKQSWSFPFKVFGMNAIVSYALSGLVITTLGLVKVEGSGLPSLAYSRFFEPVFGSYGGSLAFALAYCLLIWLMAYALYQKKIFIKV